MTWHDAMHELRANATSDRSYMSEEGFDAAMAVVTGQTETWWGIRKTGTVGFDTLIRVEHWSEADAIKAAAYNSERWGPHNVVPPVTECGSSRPGGDDGTV